MGRCRLSSADLAKDVHAGKHKEGLSGDVSGEGAYVGVGERDYARVIKGHDPGCGKGLLLPHNS